MLPPGEYIAHLSDIGDGWFWPYLDDFDRDGRIDVLFGAWSGHVWFHRNLSTPKRRHFDVTGFRLKRLGGKLIKVGPTDKDPAKDFNALQSARTVLTVVNTSDIILSLFFRLHVLPEYGRSAFRQLPICLRNFWVPGR